MNKKYWNPKIIEIIEVIKKGTLTPKIADDYYKFNSSLLFAYSVGLVANRDSINDISNELNAYSLLKEYDFFKANNLNASDDLSREKYKKCWIDLLNLNLQGYIVFEAVSYSKETQEAMLNLLVNDWEYEYKYKEDPEAASKERDALIQRVSKLTQDK